MELVDVVAAVVRRDGKYLLCLRPKHKRHGGLWEFPGGKVEKGEGFDEALRREIAEELGLSTVRVGEVLFTSQEHDSVFRIHFIQAEVSGVPVPHEHEQVSWRSVEDMTQMALAPIDFKFVQTLE